jgi:dolichol kinase
MPGGLKQEIIRKGIHLSSGILMAILYSLCQRNTLIYVHLSFLIVIWFLELLRFRGLIQVPFLRDRERKEIGAHAFFMLSTFISILAFNIRIAIASILILTVGDTASGIAQLLGNQGHSGILEGRKAVLKPPGVILIMFAVSFLVGYFVIDSLRMAIFGALGATIADGLHLKMCGIIIDDNLTIPLYSGLLMSLISLW